MDLFRLAGFEASAKSDQVLVVRRSWASRIESLVNVAGVPAVIAFWLGAEAIIEPRIAIRATITYLIVFWIYTRSEEYRRGIKELREAPILLDKATGRVSQGSVPIADFSEVERVQLRTIFSGDGEEYRLSLVLTSGQKVFLFQGGKAPKSESAAVAIAEALDVELHRKGADPWKAPLD